MFTDDELMKHAILFMTVIMNVSGQYDIPVHGHPDTASVINALGLDPAAANQFLQNVASRTTSGAIRSVANAFAQAAPYTGPGCPQTAAPIAKVAAKFVA